MERIKQKNIRTKGASSLKMVTEAPTPRPITGVKPLSHQPPLTPAPPVMLDESGIETDHAIDRIFHGKNVDYEMAEVHDKFIVEEFKGDKNMH